MVRIREGLYIQIVRFTLPEDNAKALVDTVAKHVDEWISQCTGFVSANFHISEDGKSMINYAQWRTKENFEEFLSHPKQDALKEAISQFSPERVDADPFTLAHQVSVEEQGWETTRI